MKIPQNVLSLTSIEALARDAHKGQTRRDGVTPYIEHCAAVVARIANAAVDADAIAVAWLHDVLEDTVLTEADLLSLGVAPHVVEAVVCLTKVKGGNYQDYLVGVKRNRMATEVKIADMLANLTDQPTRGQALRYVQGLAFLLDSEPLILESKRYDDTSDRAELVQFMCAQIVPIYHADDLESESTRSDILDLAVKLRALVDDA
jgi:hypothetical protein